MHCMWSCYSYRSYESFPSLGDKSYVFQKKNPKSHTSSKYYEAQFNPRCQQVLFPSMRTCSIVGQVDNGRQSEFYLRLNP